MQVVFRARLWFLTCIVEWSWRHQWQYLLKDRVLFQKLHDCFLLPCPRTPTVASIMIWTSASMPSSSTYVSASEEVLKYWVLTDRQPPPCIDVHVRLSPMLLVQLVKRSINLPRKHSQVAHTLSMHMSKKSQPAVPGNKICSFWGESQIFNTLVDSLLGMVTIAWPFPLSLLFLSRC